MASRAMGQEEARRLLSLDGRSLVDEESLRSAYLQQAAKYHPSSSQDLQLSSEERRRAFERLAEAFEVVLSGGAGGADASREAEDHYEPVFSPSAPSISSEDLDPLPGLITPRPFRAPSPPSTARHRKNSSGSSPSHVPAPLQSRGDRGAVSGEERRSGSGRRYTMPSMGMPRFHPPTASSPRSQARPDPMALFERELLRHRDTGSPRQTHLPLTSPRTTPLSPRSTSAVGLPSLPFASATAAPLNSLLASPSTHSTSSSTSSSSNPFGSSSSPPSLDSASAEGSVSSSSGVTSPRDSEATRDLPSAMSKSRSHHRAVEGEGEAKARRRKVSFPGQVIISDELKKAREAKSKRRAEREKEAAEQREAEEKEARRREREEAGREEREAEGRRQEREAAARELDRRDREREKEKRRAKEREATLRPDRTPRPRTQSRPDAYSTAPSSPVLRPASERSTNDLPFPSLGPLMSSLPPGTTTLSPRLSPLPPPPILSDLPAAPTPHRTRKTSRRTLSPAQTALEDPCLTPWSTLHLEDPEDLSPFTNGVGSFVSAIATSIVTGGDSVAAVTTTTTGSTALTTTVVPSTPRAQTDDWMQGPTTPSRRTLSSGPAGATPKVSALPMGEGVWGLGRSAEPLVLGRKRSSSTSVAMPRPPTFDPAPPSRNNNAYNLDDRNTVLPSFGGGSSSRRTQSPAAIASAGRRLRRSSISSVDVAEVRRTSEAARRPSVRRDDTIRPTYQQLQPADQRQPQRPPAVSAREEQPRPLKSALSKKPKSHFDAFLSDFSTPSPAPPSQTRSPPMSRDFAVASMTAFLALLDPHGAFDISMAEVLVDAGCGTKESLLSMDEAELRTFLAKLERRREQVGSPLMDGGGRAKVEGTLTPYQEATLPRRLEMWKARQA